MRNLSSTGWSFSRCCFTVRRPLPTWGFTQAEEEALGWQLKYLGAAPGNGRALPARSLPPALSLVKSSTARAGWEPGISLGTVPLQSVRLGSQRWPSLALLMLFLTKRKKGGGKGPSLFN